jgi:hypothetical protein
VRGGVQVVDVVALDLEAGAVLAARLQDVGDVAERVLDDAVVRDGEVVPEENRNWLVSNDGIRYLIAGDCVVVLRVWHEKGRRPA